MSTCFFIGHFMLPNKNEAEIMKMRLSANIEKLYYYGCDTFITSLTYFGFHLLAAKEIIKLKEKGLPVKLKIVHPFVNYENGFGQTSKQRMRNILSEANEIIHIKRRKDYSYYFDTMDEIFIKHSEHAIVYQTYFDIHIMNLINRAERKNIKLTVLD